MEEIGRVTRSKEQAQHSYNRLAGWYDFFSGSEKKYRQEGLARLHVQSGETVLEVGFGTGQTLLQLASLVGPGGKVCGIDISDGMLQVAAARLKKAGLAANADLRLGDAINLPFADQYFDAVFISFTLELFDTPEIPWVLAEFRRTLKSGGRLGVVAMSREGKTGLMVKAYDWAHRKLPNYVDCRPIYARRLIDAYGLKVTEVAIRSLMKMPVEIVIAEK
jgi:ubiquinone/menaquinone biosynthesis C-methylase UbiE